MIRQIPLRPDGRPQYHHYNSDAFWNTFWNINQVWGLAYPDVTCQFVNFMVDMYRNGGLIPAGPPDTRNETVYGAQYAGEKKK